MTSTLASPAVRCPADRFRNVGPTREGWSGTVSARPWSIGTAAGRPTHVRGGLAIPSRLLITGATGMIGSLLIEALIARGEEFSVMLCPGDSGGPVAGKPGVTSTEGDFDPPRIASRGARGG
jgi:hypothetical protein